MVSEGTLAAHAGSPARTAGIILMSIVLWTLAAGHIFGDSPENPANAKPAKAALLAVPLSFEANQGQTDSQVKFLSRGDGYSLAGSASWVFLVGRIEQVIWRSELRTRAVSP